MLPEKLHVPEGWAHSLVSDVFKTGRGRVISKQELESNPGNYPVFSSQSFNNEEFGKIGTYDFEGEYITWTTDGANAGTVFYRNGKFNCTNVCGTLNPIRKNILDLRFIAYLLGTQTKQYVSYVGNPKLMNNVMGNIPIAYPPLPEQQRIAEVLGSVDAAIEATKAVIDQTKTVKQGLLQTLLTRGIGHTQFKDSPLGEIPESWEVMRLADAKVKVIDGDRGAAYPKADDFFPDEFCLFLSAKNVTKNGFAFDDCQFISEEKHNDLRKGLLARGDIVITTRGTIGNLAYYDQSVPYDWIRINSGMVILRNDAPGLGTDYFLTLMKSEVVERQISEMSFGSAQQQLTVKILNDLLLPIPPIDEQKVIAARFNEAERFYSAETEKLFALQTLKKGLMDDLLTGKVRVNA